MAKNYGTITITYNTSSTDRTAFWAGEVASALGELLGVTLAQTSEGAIQYNDKTLLKISSSSSTSAQSLQFYFPITQTNFGSFYSMYTQDLKLDINYIKSGNWLFLHFVGSKLLSDDVGRYCLIHKNSQNFGITYMRNYSNVPYQPITSLFENIYYITDSTTKQLYKSFNINPPTGKIYVSNAILYDVSSNNFISEEKDILTCSNVGFDTDIRFNDKNYHAIAKNFVMEKTED